MKFKSEHDNPLPDLVELKAEVVPKGEGDSAHEVLVELRVHPYEMEETFGLIRVAISEATLSVQFSGLEAVPRTKLGNPVVEPTTRREVQRERSVTLTSDNEKTQTGRVGVGASTTGVDGKVERGGGTTEKSGQVTTERVIGTEVVDHRSVRAIGNDNWKISATAGDVLDGVYINHDALCEVTPIAGTNRVGVETELIVKQRYLRAEIVSEQSWLASLRSINQKKILSVLIAKSLHDTASDSTFNGTFIFAKAHSFDEG